MGLAEGEVAVIGDTEDKITAEAVEGSSAKYVPARSVLMVMPVTETGHDLLARVAEERGGGRRVEDALPSGASTLPLLPTGWRWAILDSIAASVRNGTAAALRATSNKHEILRISAVRPLRFCRHGRDW